MYVLLCEFACCLEATCKTPFRHVDLYLGIRLLSGDRSGTDLSDRSPLKGVGGNKIMDRLSIFIQSDGKLDIHPSGFCGADVSGHGTAVIRCSIEVYGATVQIRLKKKKKKKN